MSTPPSPEKSQPSLQPLRRRLACRPRPHLICPGSGNWLDFLSGNNLNASNPNNPNSNNSSAGGPGAGSRSSSMSWERGGPQDMFSGGNRGRAGLSGLGLGSAGGLLGGMGGRNGGKRKGEDKGPGGILASPASLNGKKDMKDR
ncbi:hypothetical protein BDN70DRAFT_998820 [Pholiota conissans]|uniref:Uncharacterized protein n=1 Tax=Pholiota conissans TaxID=109636 RepID=A0A9P6CS95_9AGAR|nr:hypothetical protein BDN70DRAFT_998820 [Pholiota conissans]